MVCAASAKEKEIFAGVWSAQAGREQQQKKTLNIQSV